MSASPGRASFLDRCVYRESPPVAPRTPLSALIANDAADEETTGAQFITTDNLAEQVGKSNAGRGYLLDLQLAEAKRVQKEQKIEIAKLKKELAQYRKHEGAVGAVFERNYEKETDLGRQQLALDLKEVEQKAEAERLRVEKDSLERKNAHLRSFWSCSRPFCPTKAEENSAPPQNQDKPVVEQAAKKIRDKAKLKEWCYPDIDMDDPAIQLLRRRDYYRGWLDCARDVEIYHAPRNGIEDVNFLFDEVNPQSPPAAGAAVGAYFAWSAVCRLHHIKRPDMRLDDKEWVYVELTPPTAPAPEFFRPFWKGVREGVDSAIRHFKETVEDAGLKDEE